MGDVVVITGCAGFIGSHVADHFLANGYTVVGYDAFTYAGKIENLKFATSHPQFSLIEGSINDTVLLEETVRKSGAKWIINLAAETHVDNSIRSCDVFLQTNILGTKSILDVCRSTGTKLLHFSTDEVYGVPSGQDSFKEDANLNPKNPYSASKAAGDHLIAAYANTYGLQYIIVRPSNNFGPRQHEEKFLPKMIKNLLSGKKIPVYGDGSQIREWTFVKTTAAATRFILENSKMNETYNITTGEFMRNIDVINRVCEMVNLHAADFIEYVPDRLGHDFRYSINADKLKKLGFNMQSEFPERLWETVQETR
jgi:dTDP-glucose 4,6-dehydratase